MMASKGAVLAILVVVEGFAEVEAERWRSEVLEERRSVAEERILVEAEVAWASEVVYIFWTA